MQQRTAMAKDIPVFFCHVMKTAGTSVRLGLLKSGIFEAHQMAPYLPNGKAVDLLPFYVINPFLMKDKLPKELGAIRFISGHYPFLAYRLFPAPLATASLFRDPIDRAVSHLKHLQRQSFPDRSYEDVYNDKKVFDDYLYNLQARAFVFEDENVNSLMQRTFDWNEELFERAKRNVELLDIIGLTDEFPTFIRSLEEAFGWKFKEIAHYHDAPKTQPEVPESLRERMREDLDYDVRFYEHVKKVYAERQVVRAAEESSAAGA